MATAYKRLGAIASAGVIGTGDTLYDSGGTKTAVLSTIAICNTAATPATYRLGVSTTSAFAAAGYLVYGGTVAANDTVFLTIGAVVDPVNRYLLASASANTVSFSAFGSEA